MSNGYFITAERQKQWDTSRNLLKDYLQDNSGKYPEQGKIQNYIDGFPSNVLNWAHWSIQTSKVTQLQKRGTLS